MSDFFPPPLKQPQIRREINIFYVPWKTVHSPKFEKKKKKKKKKDLDIACQSSEENILINYQDGYL